MTAPSATQAYMLSSVRQNGHGERATFRRFKRIIKEPVFRLLVALVIGVSILSLALFLENIDPKVSKILAIAVAFGILGIGYYELMRSALKPIAYDEISKLLKEINDSALGDKNKFSEFATNFEQKPVAALCSDSEQTKKAAQIAIFKQVIDESVARSSPSRFSSIPESERA
jgi:hypothetical protein